MVGILLGFLAHLFVWAAASLIIYLVWLIQQQRRVSQRPTFTSRISPSMVRSSSCPQKRSHSLKPNVPRRAVVSPYLENRLISMLNGEVRTAQRLINHVRDANPGPTPDWYVEKVIYDLEQDRR